MASQNSDATETVKAESPGVSLGEEGDSSKISTDVPDSTTKDAQEKSSTQDGSTTTDTAQVNSNEEVEADKTTTTSNSSNNSTNTKETVAFKVIYNKQKHDVTFPLDDTVTDLKKHLEEITGVPASMQKVMFKGRMKDEATLREQKVNKGARIMLIGSTVNDVMSVSAPDPKILKQEEKEAAAAAKQSLCKLKPHKTVLEKHGKPDDVIPGIKNRKDPLPSVPLSGMYNKSGGKVRLTFKLEQDQLWIGTKERTDKIPMNSIKTVVSEPIDDHEEYHIMGIQLGPTEASRYWVYWVPAQYADAIKDAILGKWQFF